MNTSNAACVARAAREILNRFGLIKQLPFQNVILLEPEFCTGDIADRRLMMNHQARRCKPTFVGYNGIEF